MPTNLAGKTIAIIAADMVEQVELVEPRKALEQAGAEKHLISMESGTIQGFNHFDKADRHKVDKTIEMVDASEYDGPADSGRRRQPRSHARRRARGALHPGLLRSG